MNETPDLIDIAHGWLKEQHPELFYEVVTNRHVTDGKIVIVHHRSWTYETHDPKNHIFTLSKGGHCWHTTSFPEFKMKLQAGNPDFFETLKWLIRRAKNRENR